MSPAASQLRAKRFADPDSQALSDPANPRNDGKDAHPLGGLRVVGPQASANTARRLFEIAQVVKGGVIQFARAAMRAPISAYIPASGSSMAKTDPHSRSTPATARPRCQADVRPLPWSHDQLRSIIPRIRYLKMRKLLSTRSRWLSM